MMIILYLILAIGLAINPAYAQEVTGVVRAEEMVSLRSEVAGIVESIEVAEGQEVPRGTTLIKLRSERQQIGVRLAEVRITRARAAVVASQVTLENAQNELARIQQAAAALPRKELEDIRDEVERLEALLQAQQAELGQVDEELLLRRHELQEAGIVAPFNGTVTNIPIKRGDTLRPLETQILDLVNLDRLYVELVLPVEDLPKISTGREVRVQVESSVLGRAGQVSGSVSYINPTVDPSSRTFAIKILITDPARNIRPGMRAQVRLP